MVCCELEDKVEVGNVGAGVGRYRVSIAIARNRSWKLYLRSPFSL